MLPCLQTSRLFLRQVDWADFPDLHEQWQLPCVARFLFAGRHSGNVSAAFFREASIDAERGFGIWTIQRHHSPEILGSAGLLAAPRPRPAADSATPVAEIIVHVHPAFWGRGYATEGLMAVITYAFEFLGISSLVAGIDDRNSRSFLLFQRLGFVPEHAISETCLRIHCLRAVQGVRGKKVTNSTKNRDKNFALR